ncbi:MAG: TonB-dependent receptor [Bacteroidota bacterium]
MNFAFMYIKILDKVIKNKLLLMLILTLFIKVNSSFALNTIPDSEKRYTISGKIKDAKTGEELIGATVFIKEIKTGIATNVYGFYSISIPAGNYTLMYSFIGYEGIEKKIELKSNISINIELTPIQHQLGEVVISAERKNENVVRNEMSVIKMDSKTIKQIPALLGEVDIIKALELLPGIQTTSEGSSGFSVRGGASDQNLILLDEATIYSVSHFLGFFSIFNNDAIKDVTIYKGDIPMNYGGRLSSVLDVRMNDGNSKRFTATGGVGIISSRLTLEGPIKNEKTTYVISGRRTYYDLFFPLSPNADIKNDKLYFYDFNAKITHQFDEKNRLFISGYLGRDVFSNANALMTYGNQTFTMRWNHLFSNKLFSNFSFVQSTYNYNLGNPGATSNSFTWDAAMKDYGLKADFTYYPNPNNTIKFGASSTYHVFNPGSVSGIGSQTSFTQFLLPSDYTLEHGIYIGNDQKLNEKLSIKYGLRYSIFQNVGSATVYHFNSNFESTDSSVYSNGKIFNTYSGLEPRLGLIYKLNEFSSIKASYSRTYQYVQIAQNSTAGTPLDIWFPASPNVKPQRADQFAVGYFRNFLDDLFETSIECYYKTLNNSIDFKDNAELFLNKKLEGELRFGTARSYGLEVYIKKSLGKFYGWISYTLSRTDRTFPDINNGNTYLSYYDKPHNISVVANYEFSSRHILSANWVYYSGAPVTFPTGRAVYGNEVIPIYSDRNAYRMPDYHRLDLSFTIKGKIKPNKRFTHEWVFSVYNVYDRHNTWAINFIQDKTDPNITYAQKTYLFSIIPAVTYNFKF